MDLKKEIAALTPELIELRRDFHRHPEIGKQEFRTAQIIEDYLNNLGLDVHRCLETGIIGVLKGGRPGKTLMLRSDIDALPVEEMTGLPFASENPGLMHACGHDGHMSVMLIVAKILTAHRDEIPGTIVFLFQPNEEDAGAEDMIQAGALDNPKPDVILGMHLWSYLPSGSIGIIPGPIMASSYYFKLTITGQGGHGGAPHACINPIDCGVHVWQAFQAYHTLENNSLHPTTITVGKFQGGQYNIVIPDTCVLEGSVRCLHNDDEQVRNRLAEMIDGVCKTYRCTYELEFKCGNTLLDNDPQIAEMIRETGAEVLGADKVISKDVGVMIGEDFAEFTRRVPGAFYFFGVADEAKGTHYEHHNNRFNIDEDVLPSVVEMQVSLAKKYLGF
jgi:amidohydrolase